MNARAYFDLMDAIAAARTADELETMHARVASTEMHPFERLALGRQLRARELAVLTATGLGRSLPSVGAASTRFRSGI
jgi:hypothetical protein